MRRARKVRESDLLIREVTTDAELRKSARVIQRSFKTVADQFGLTRENCPTHTAFLTTNGLKEQKNSGLKCFGLFAGEKQVGFVGVEKYDPDTLVRLDPGTVRFWLEKLAVLWSERHNGYGEKLVSFAIDYVRQNGGTRIALGMMNEHTILKEWYFGLGFKEVELKTFPHLPFTVCFMEKDL